MFWDTIHKLSEIALDAEAAGAVLEDAQFWWEELGDAEHDEWNTDEPGVRFEHILERLCNLQAEYDGYMAKLQQNMQDL